MPTYRTFKRSATSFEQFAKAKRIPDADGLTEEKARERCAYFNSHRTPDQIRLGTKLEYTEE